MRALLQRVKRANVSIDGSLNSSIGRGALIFLGVAQTDTVQDATYLAHRCGNLRMFEDIAGKMNLSLKDVNGSALVVSQFTLVADTRKGHRPSFGDAAPPEIAEQLYREFVTSLTAEVGESAVRTGIFRAMMDVELVNDGPVTILIDSKNIST